MDDIRQRFERYRATEMEQQAKIQEAMDEELPRQLEACTRALSLLRAEELVDGLNSTVMEGKGAIEANDGIFDEQNARMAVASLSLLWERQDKVGFSRYERRYNRLVIYAHGDRLFLHSYDGEGDGDRAPEPGLVRCGLSLRVTSGHTFPDLWETVTQLPYRLIDTTGDFNHTFDLRVDDENEVESVRELITEQLFRTLETKRYLFQVAEQR